MGAGLDAIKSVGALMTAEQQVRQDCYLTLAPV